MKEKTKAIARVVVTALVLVNAVLEAKGINPIPVNDTAIYEVASYAASAITTVWVWWKNNNVTKAAQNGQEIVNIAKAVEDQRDTKEV